MKNWQRMVDEMLKEAIGDGDVSALPGAGKKLPPADKSIPNEWQLAFKIMQEQNVLPEWVAAGKALAQREAQLREKLKARAAAYRREVQATRARPTAQAEVEKRWHSYSADFRQRVERYNRELLLYNLKLPAGLPHRQSLNSDQLIAAALGAAAAV